MIQVEKTQEKRMIIVVGGIKGGSGKTTLATNLVVLRSKSGAKVLFVDSDEQKSACDWAEQRAAMALETGWPTIHLAGRRIYEQIEKMGADYDDVIVDTGGRDTTSQRSALAIADIFLIPFKPRSLDIWTIGPVKTLISEMKAVNPNLKCIAVINQADAKGEDNNSAMEVLRECPDLVCLECSIGHRKVFGNAAAEGMGVAEMKVQDKKATQEMKALYDCIFSTQIACV